MIDFCIHPLSTSLRIFSSFLYHSHHVPTILFFFNMNIFFTAAGYETQAEALAVFLLEAAKYDASEDQIE